MLATTTPLLLAHRSAAIHTLPKLPYAYGVSDAYSSLPVRLTHLSQGPRTAHLGRDYGAAPYEAPPGPCQQPKCCSECVLQGALDA